MVKTLLAIVVMTSGLAAMELADNTTREQAECIKEKGKHLKKPKRTLESLMAAHQKMLAIVADCNATIKPFKYSF